MAGAYEFECDQSLSEMLALLNQVGPWDWSIRESYWYGDYLICRPMDGVRIRIHHPAEFFVQSPENREPQAQRTYTAQLDFNAQGVASQAEIDAVFRTLLASFAARQVREIEAYD